MSFLIAFEDPNAEIRGWVRTLDFLVAIPFIVAITLGPAFLVAWFVSRLLPAEPLTFFGGAALFVVGSVSSCGIYGHFSPMPVMLMIILGDAGRESFAWMGTTGLLVTAAFGWRRREYRKSLPGPPV